MILIIRQRQRLLAGLIVVLLLGGFVYPLAGQEGKPPGAKALTAAQQAKLAEAQKLGDEAAKQYADNRPPDSIIPALQKKLALEKEVLGPRHHQVAQTLAVLAEMFEENNEFDKARAHHQEVIAIKTELKTPAWEVAEAKQALADSERLVKLPQFKRLTLIGARVVEAKLLSQESNAFRSRSKAVTCVVRSLCTAHVSSSGVTKATSMFGVEKNPETLLLNVLKIREETLGAEHPHCAVTLNNLAALAYTQGNHAQAEKYYDRALAIKRKAFGVNHPDYAITLGNLALLHQVQGEFARAEPIFQQSLELLAKNLGQDQALYALGLNNWAGLYVAMGDLARAEPKYQEALKIYQKAAKEFAPDHALCLNNAAVLYALQKRPQEAEKLYRQSLDLLQAAGKGQHLEYATGLINLAAACQARGDFAVGEGHYLEALKIIEAKLGKDHPDSATALNNLSALYQAAGKLDKAETICRAALEMRKKVLPEAHPALAVSYHNLAGILHAKGDAAQAGTLYRQGLRLTRQHLDQTAGVQSERQQLAMLQFLRHQLDGYLSWAPQGKLAVDEVYQEVLAWKGTVFERQRKLRLLRDLAKSSPQAKQYLADLASISRELANLTFSSPEPNQVDTWREQLQTLTNRREQLEQKLAGLYPLFKQQQAQITPVELRKRLPPETALVDYFEYSRHSPAPSGKGKVIQERSVLAFVLRADRPAVLCQLGSASTIAESVANWRQTIKARQLPLADDQDFGVILRQQVWKPLEEHLQGVKTVLISPDGSLTRLPFGALPGKKPGTYLIEEVALAVAPFAPSLPELPASPANPAPALLVVGNVDFGATPAKAPDEPGSPRAPVEKIHKWAPLDGTVGEIVVIKSAFEKKHRGGKVTLLEEEQATKPAVVAHAAKHQFLHLATHGFFASKEMRSALAAPDGQRGSPEGLDLLSDKNVIGFPPGLLSGLVFAGANHRAKAGVDDGILTALEVAELDLAKVELAVLSACETGLGEVAGGEGVLGLQRAFQVAGARSVIASLWKVPDDPTRVLMERFYANLWHKTKPLNKLDALREVQLWMLREGPTRGFDFDAPKDAAGPRRAPPYYWAGFVLSGDWR